MANFKGINTGGHLCAENLARAFFYFVLITPLSYHIDTYCMTLNRNICLRLKDSKNVCAQCHKAEHIL
jgi:hypothetical protein